jgi:hypothetical protein
MVLPIFFFFFLSAHAANDFTPNNVKQVVQKCHKQIITSDYHLAMRGCMLCELSISEMELHKKGNLRGPSTNELITATTTKSSDVVTAFNQVYSNHVWGPEGGGSGPGSSENGGHSIKMWIEKFIFTYGIKTYIDAPCGAVHSSWTKGLLADIRKNMKCFKYYGFDAAEAVINKNINYFRSDENIKFQQMDLSSSTATLPQNADLIFCRDALQHLTYRAIAGVFATFCRSHATYLMVGSYLESTINNDIPNIGNYFSINLLAAPFSFGEPMDIIKDYHEGDNPKYILIYHLTSLCSTSALHSFVNTYNVKNI